MTATRHYMVQRLWERLRHPRDATDRALARVLGRKWKTKTMRIVFSRVETPETVALEARKRRIESGFLLFGAVSARDGRNRLAREAFNRVSDAMLVRYALPEAAKALAASDEDADRGRALSLLRAGRERWREIRFRLPPDRRLQLATACAALGDAEGVEFSTACLACQEADALKRMFAEQQRTARALSASTDYVSVRNAVLSLPSRGTRARLIDAPPSDFPLAVAVEGPVWLPVSGSFGQSAHPGHRDFPFPGNVRPLFTAFHITRSHLDDENLSYLRRFEPIGCRDLFTARLLRGAGVKAFVGGEALPQPVSAAIRAGQSEAKTYALWRKAVAPAMARTDALIAEQYIRYPVKEVSLESLGLDQVPVRVIAQPLPGALRPVAQSRQTSDAKRRAGGAPEAERPKACRSRNPIHLLFSFDHRLAEAFPGTLEGIRRHASRPLVVYVFGRGLSAAMFERWAVQFPKTRFVWRDLSGLRGEGIAVGHHRSASLLDNLLAPALLLDVEKIVYLDVDLLVRKDIGELFDTELGDAPLAAHVNDERRVSYGKDGGLPEERLAAFRNAYFSGGSIVWGVFNSGVVVMDLARMRRERAVEKMLTLVRVHGLLSDEGALNLYARDRCKPIAGEWNFEVFWTGMMEDPAIAHFVGQVKPWAVDMPNPFHEEWRENAANARKRLAEARR